MTTRATLRAGYPASNPWLYRVAPFPCGDAAAFIEIPDKGTRFVVRDIELGRAREAKIADAYYSPQDLAPAAGLSGDRDTATAQAAAELLRREGVAEVWTDRSLPMIFAHFAQEAGVRVRCDPDMGVAQRRMKSRREVEALRKAQRATERAVAYACELIGAAEADKHGVLQHEGEALTSERVIALINIWLLERGMGVSGSIVAGGRDGADCHNRGAGPLRTGQPVIVDVFPMDTASRYYGDCTRTVVHGDIPDEVAKMHRAVVDAKLAAIGRTKAGATGAQVHQASIDTMTRHGYPMGLPPEGAAPDFVSMQHGTGHGVGLDVHEPPLLDIGGPELLAGDCLTIEPGLYHQTLGGVRVEDMVIVTDDGCENLNAIPEGLTWG